MILSDTHSLYGVTAVGGDSNLGTVFSMTTKGNEAVIYSFNGGSNGATPSSVLVSDGAGNIYGTTVSGGNNCGVNGCGTVFELSPTGGGWTQKTLYVFCQLSRCADGWTPRSGPLVIDQAGNIYGTTESGGTEYNCGGTGCGTVFKLDPSGSETVLYSFSGGADGNAPEAGLIMDDKGNLYGTATRGGDLNCPQGSGQGCGVVFELTPDAPWPGGPLNPDPVGRVDDEIASTIWADPQPESTVRAPLLPFPPPTRIPVSLRMPGGGLSLRRSCGSKPAPTTNQGGL